MSVDVLPEGVDEDDGDEKLEHEVCSHGCLLMLLILIGCY